MEWKEYFINLTNTVREKSKDPSTKFGCVIVGPDNEIRSTGYNSFPRGMNDNDPKKFERPEKYLWFEHSERNAIYNAARVGIPLNGCTMYISKGLPPCMDCSRAIVQSGIKKVVFSNEYLSGNNEKWEENCSKSLELFKECNVEVELY
jgi:dCMP deaminase